MAIQEHYEQLGIEPGVTLADVKTAYRTKLRQFPAHSHPKEFKEIRAAYEAIQTQLKTPSVDAFFELPPIDTAIDQAAIAQLKSKATENVSVTLKELIVLTF